MNLDSELAFYTIKYRNRLKNNKIIVQLIADGYKFYIKGDVNSKSL